MQQWDGFLGQQWKQKIDVEDFIVNNYKEYTGTSDFLTDSSRRTNKIYNRCVKLFEKESLSGILDVDSNNYSGIDNFYAGYIDKKNEAVVGLQTDEPLKYSINPFVALTTSVKELKNAGYRFNKDSIDKFNEARKTYEKCVNDTYTKFVKKYKEVNLIGGLPDNYGRGFIVGDYRRIALYGVNHLINYKLHDLDLLNGNMNYSIIRTRDEVVKQIKSLKAIKNLANYYGFDIGRPASNAKEAVQWLYFGYLAAIKENYGVSMPFGNNSAFLDIYIERDINNGILTENGAQELIDQLILKLRLVRFLFDDNYAKCYFGKNCFITETIGGIVNDRSLITKTAYRFINSVNNIDEYSILNINVLWSDKLPSNFKKYCISIMLKHNILEFTNGDLFNSNDYASTCSASFSKIGKQIDYYGGSINLPKVLLYAINGGVDEITGEKIIDGIEPITDDILEYSSVVKNFSIVLKNVLSVQGDASNIIHYNFDKCAYESSIMALNNTVVERYMTFDIVGFVNVVDSLSAIRYSKVKVTRDENGLTKDFTLEQNYPRFGKDNNDVDKLAIDIVKLINKIISGRSYYRNAKPKIGINSYSMNIVYGKSTGSTPDGRFKGSSYSIGINPVSNIGADNLINVLNSILKVPSNLCTNGITTTLNIIPSVLSSNNSLEKILKILDEFFNKKGIHLEINIIDPNRLLEAYNNSNKYQSLVLRNSGCLVLYNNLTFEQKDDLMDRTFYKNV